MGSSGLMQPLGDQPSRCTAQASQQLQACGVHGDFVCARALCLCAAWVHLTVQLLAGVFVGQCEHERLPPQWLVFVGCCFCKHMNPDSRFFILCVYAMPNGTHIHMEVLFHSRMRLTQQKVFKHASN